ncbi:hypothetical protein LX83_004595 [Goodfellowiella coeruleoviolacea]|uniref:Uncharacterized protein n=2 Tax=Goodfellowiella coeruleoviolacea TaxID=334858 RepID=A0AAE3KI90_9PSEU|nr:hypothetical protein [Goodfellowiella coeruleoviolacea]
MSGGLLAVLAPHGHPLAAPAGPGWATWLRLLVLAALVVLTGAALLRPVAAPGRAARVVVATAGVAVVVGESALAVLAERPPAPVSVVVPLGLALAAVVVAAVGWRFAAAVGVAATAVAGAECGVAWFGDAAQRLVFDRAALLTGVAALAWFAAARPRRALPVHGTAVVVAVVVLAGAAQLTAVDPRRPVAGLPWLRDVVFGETAAQVLLAPHRPGWNLVRVSADGIAVGTDPAALTDTAPRPGTTGRWALVALPEGRGSLWLRRGEDVVSLPVDTGSSRGTPPSTLDMSTADGPECADAALGALLAGRPTGTSCPADDLADSDAEALRAAVGFLARRGHRSATLVADTSPRSVAAGEVVRESLRRNGMSEGHGPVVVVSGWAEADRALRDVAEGRLPGEGSYLAPWLLTAPLLAIPAAAVIPLRENPQEPAALAYVSALRDRVPEATATPAGYAAWRGGPGPGPLRLYAASVVTMQLSTTGHNHDGARWFPGGALAPVSGPLSAADPTPGG